MLLTILGTGERLGEVLCPKKKNLLEKLIEFQLRMVNIPGSNEKLVGF